MKRAPEQKYCLTKFSVFHVFPRISLTHTHNIRDYLFCLFVCLIFFFSRNLNISMKLW